MSTSSRPPSRVVFVGNIPYGLSEEQITDIFSSVGKVELFRLVYDPETGRPKGFGFADYPDTDSAASAVRNLNDYEIMGRKLRVDFSTDKNADDGGHQNPSSSSYSASNNANGSAAAGFNAQASTIPPLPAGKELPAGVSCADSVSRTLNTLPPSQLLDILVQMKTLATNEPQRAVELLQQAPQLSYAVFQSLLLMGLVSPEAIQSVVEPSAAPAAAPPPAAYAPPAPIPGYMGAPVANNTPPAATSYVPPAAAPAPAAQDTDALMRAVMELPQSQIDQLSEPERAQIMALRAQFGGGR